MNNRKIPIGFCPSCNRAVVYSDDGRDKEFFMNFLLSEEYNNIPRKSQTHLDDIHKIYRKLHKGG